MDPFTSAYLANISGALTMGMISGAKKRIQKDLEKSETRQALQRCVYMGTIAAVTIAKTDTPEEEELLAEILERFFNDQETAGELNDLLLGKTPDREELRYLFEDAGYDDQSLPGVQFDVAMASFESGFITAALQEDTLQKFIQTGRLIEQTHIQRDILTVVKELVEFVKGEGADRIVGIRDGSIVVEDGKQIAYQPEEAGGVRFTSKGNHV